MEAFVGLRELLRSVKAKKTFAEIATEAKLPGKAAGQTVNDALNRNDGLSYLLADYVLRQTICAGDPIERAMAALAEAGIPAEQLPGLRSVIDSIPKKVQTSAKAESAVDYEVIKPGVVLAISNAPHRMKLPEGFTAPQKGRTNRRNEYRIIPILDRAAKNSVQIPCFEAVAAGFGEDLERSEELVHVRELPDWKGVHSLVVRGDSMEDTLHPRDMILIETFNNGDGLTMEALQPDQEKTPFQQVQKRIPDDEIFVLSIDDEPPTVKRVLYDTHKPADWHLLIQADNAQYKPRVLTRGTPIRFYGRLIAIGQREGKKQYSDHKPVQLPIPKGMKKR